MAKAGAEVGKTKFVDVNNHSAQIWDDAFNIVLAHMIEVASEIGISDADLQSWVMHASVGGDSFAFSYSQTHDPHHFLMGDILRTTRVRVHAMGDVTPEIVAEWTIGPDHRLVSEGRLRGNEPIEVGRLLEVVDWFDRALRSDPGLEQDLLIADRYRP